ncbi:MAG: NADPH-dependent FMN reductase [Acidimicrobiia bacterium]
MTRLETPPDAVGESTRPLSILAVAGSLRRDSHNKALLRATSKLAPEGVTIGVFEGLEAIPVFNQDLEGVDGDPPGVIELRRALERADGLLIATPEYNQSVPGVVKNMVDWLSRGDPEQGLTGRPVAVIGASTGQWGTRIAQTLLRQMLLSAQALVLPHPTLFVARVEALLDAGGELADQETLGRLQEVVTAFADWIRLVSPLAVAGRAAPGVMS